MRLGAAIREVANASAAEPASQHALPNIGDLIERVREARSRSSSQAPSQTDYQCLDTPRSGQDIEHAERPLYVAPVAPTPQSRQGTDTIIESAIPQLTA